MSMIKLVRPSKTKSSGTSLEEKRTPIFVAAIVITALLSFYYLFSASKSVESNLATASTKTNRTRGGSAVVGKTIHNNNAEDKADEICSDVCTDRQTKRSESSESQNDLLDYEKLILKVKNATNVLLNNLKKDYGDYFEPIFFDPRTGRYRPILPLTDDGVSLDRLKRKLSIKILSMQYELTQRDSDFHGCDCSVGGNSTALRPDDVLDALNSDESSSIVLEGLDDEDEHENKNNHLLESYVWATGGHSAAASHGNLYNESYSAFMEADLSDVFGSIGIGFEARNYAMGGASSATFTSMCWKEIYGEDVDFFSWDFGIIDKQNYERLFHYFYRGVISRGRPALMLLRYGGSAEAERLEALRHLQDMGAAAFVGSEDSTKAMREAVPDSAGIDAESIEALPEYVRNYKCGDYVEKGDPYCARDKFSKWGCHPRMRQQTWHPGYKDQAIVGHGIALFFVETLLSTIQGLAKLDDSGSVSQRLARLLEEDIDLHKNFQAAELPNVSKKLLNLPNAKLRDSKAWINHTLFFKGPSMCHTALLPAQTRYYGILTETDRIGGPAPVGEEGYYVGYDKEEALLSATQNSELRLTYIFDDEREAKCDGVTIKPDYKDAWFANSMDGWTKLKFPNDAEKEFYGYNPEEYQGILLLHMKPCPRKNKCVNGLFATNFRTEDWEMRVNSQRVVDLIDIKQGASVIEVEKTGFHIEPDSNGQYTIEIKVNKKDHYVEIWDFVLY